MAYFAFRQLTIFGAEYFIALSSCFEFPLWVVARPAQNGLWDMTVARHTKLFALAEPVERVRSHSSNEIDLINDVHNCGSRPAETD
jgi:hypothetical protein